MLTIAIIIQFSYQHSIGKTLFFKDNNSSYSLLISSYFNCILSFSLLDLR